MLLFIVLAIVVGIAIFILKCRRNKDTQQQSNNYDDNTINYYTSPGAVGGSSVSVNVHKPNGNLPKTENEAARGKGFEPPDRNSNGAARNVPDEDVYEELRDRPPPGPYTRLNLNDRQPPPQYTDLNVNGHSIADPNQEDLYELPKDGQEAYINFSVQDAE
ncbi:uncharacterized protein [Amphiura filiformis]|uniref:uncharacterized protein n=1 Tax=Amphiura filiformis TaxID=82378 RepID=UPI003B220D7A